MSIQIWRISKTRYESTAFSGEGAKLFGGRWNSKGKSVVYTSANLSLAVLETFVHLGVKDIKTDFVSIQAEIPDDVLIDVIAKENLPSDWQIDPAPKSLAIFGDQWFDYSRTAVLCVPSSVNPVENNYILNPLHSDFNKINIYPSETFEFDSRMWKSEKGNS